MHASGERWEWLLLYFEAGLAGETRHSPIPKEKPVHRKRLGWQEEAMVRSLWKAVLVAHVCMYVHGTARVVDCDVTHMWTENISDLCLIFLVSVSEIWSLFWLSLSLWQVCVRSR